MNAIEFTEQTLILAKDQPEYVPLPVHVKYYRDEKGLPIRGGAGGQFVPEEMTCCFQLSPEEVAEVNRTGCFWFTQSVLGGLFNPVRMSISKPAVFDPPPNKYFQCEVFYKEEGKQSGIWVYVQDDAPIPVGVEIDDARFTWAADNDTPPRYRPRKIIDRGNYFFRKPFPEEVAERMDHALKDFPKDGMVGNVDIDELKQFASSMSVLCYAKLIGEGVRTFL